MTKRDLLFHAQKIIKQLLATQKCLDNPVDTTHAVDLIIHSPADDWGQPACILIWADDEKDNVEIPFEYEDSHAPENG